MKSDLLLSLRQRVRDAKPFPDGRAVLLLREFRAAQREFKRLLSTSPSEHEAHAFLEATPVLLLHAALDGFYPVASLRSCLFSKVPLGSQYQTDFAYCSGNSIGLWWTFIELESPSRRLFTRAGDPSKYLGHAMRQVANWKSWVDDNPQYARDQLFNLLTGNPVCETWQMTFRRPISALIVMGRRSALTQSANRLRAQLCHDNPGLQVMTYDRLIDSYDIDKDAARDGGRDEVETIRERG